MSQGNGVLSNLFSRESAAKPAPSKEKENLSPSVKTMDLSPESIVTSPNFILVDGVLFGAVEITPLMAEAWLSRNVSNVRKLQESKVGLFAEAMKKDQWDLNGESIKFNQKGELVDGQNRLQASVNCKKSFKSNVVYGIESVDNVDRGKPRTVGQIIQGKGISHDSNVMSAAINYLHAYNDVGSRGFVTVGHGRHPLTIDDALQFAHDNASDLNHSIKATQKCKKLFNKFSLHTALHYLFAKTSGKSYADDFYASLCEGVGLTSKNPVYHLRERLLKEKASGKQPQINSYAGLIIKGWNYYITERELESFRYVYANEGVPVIKRSPISK